MKKIAKLLKGYVKPPKQMHHKKGYTDSKQAYEKMFPIMCHEGITY